MLLDQSSNQLLKTNFLGRDGFIWWIGQIALPETSKWNESDLSAKKSGEPLYYNRVKVRIFGYHTGKCTDLTDEQLPWAHIMIPPGISNGNVKQGRSHQYKGGETVIGFFLDGDDAQQPVIFGSLYKSSDIKSISKESVISKSCSEFKPFNPASASAHNSLSPLSYGGKNVGTGVGDINQKGQAAPGNTSGIDNVSHSSPQTTSAGFKAFADKVNNKTTSASICDNNSFTRITTAIEKLLKKIKNYQQTASFYINTKTNKLGSFTGEIRKIGELLTGDISGLIKKGMNFLFEKLSNILGLSFGGLFPKTKQSKIAKTIDKILEAIYCIFKQLGLNLFDLVLNALTNFIGKAIGATVCAIQNFIGQLLAKILNAIENAILPLLNQLNSIVQGALGSVAGVLSSAMGLIGIIKGLVSCVDSSKNCEPPTTFSMAQGIDLGFIDDFSNVLKQIGNVGGLIGNIGDAVLDIGKIDLNKNGCKAESKKCGPPRIVIAGGGGTNASANSVVNGDGKIIGAIVTNKGSGYVEEPIVSFIDDCDLGRYARAKAIMDGDKVEKIVILDPGEDYINNIVDQTYGQDDTSVPTTDNTNTDGTSYIPTLDSVEIVNPGYGYDENTTVNIGGCKVKTTIDTAGTIVNVEVLGNCYFDQLPPVIINSENGAAAVLKPVLKFTEVGKDEAPKQIIKVIDCVQR
jgi:hypothetical protein